MLGRMGYQIVGKIHRIFAAEQKTERFRKRDFVLALTENQRFPQLVQFQLTGDRCEALDRFGEGDEVRVEFSLRGREWTSPRGETRYFNSLDVWAIESAKDASFGDEPPPPDEPPPGMDEPPF